MGDRAARKRLILLFVAAAVPLLPRTALALPGTLDSSFGSGGLALTNFGTTPGPTAHDFGRAIALQPDGSIVTAGTQETSAGTKAFALSRHVASGALDPSFGSGGKVTTAFSGAKASGLALALSPDGMVVVAGGVEPSTGSGMVALARYLPGGALDSSFGTGGRVTTDLSAALDYASGVAVQPDGKIVAAVTSGTSFGLVRYNPDGSRDDGFGSGGTVLTAFPGLQAEAAAMTLQPDGKIVVAGTVDDGFDVFDMAIARYLSNGTIDGAFGSGGTRTVDVSGGYDFANAVIVLPDGKIVLAGQADVGQSTRMALVRLTFDGVLDSSFGGSGKVTTDFADLFGGSTYTISTAYAVALEAGRLVAGGVAGVTRYEFALARYSLDGALDSGFGAGGRVTTSPGGFDDEVRALAVEPGGKILAAGYSYQGSYDFALARYQIAYASGADLHPLVSAGDGVAGSALTISAFARNDGPEAGSDVTISVALPPSVSFDAATPSQGSCAFAAGTLTCQLGTVAASAAPAVSILVTPSAAGTLFTTATVSSSSQDPYPQNASLTFASRVRSSATSYQSIQTQNSTTKDATGQGTATASSSADPNGSMSANAVSSDSLPVGVYTNGISAGHTSATGSARVVQAFPVTGPIFTVTVVINSQAKTVAGINAPRIGGYRDGVAQVHGRLEVSFHPCAAASGCAATATAANGTLVAQPGLSRPTVTLIVTLRAPAGFTGTGVLLVGAGLNATATSYGSGRCDAHATGSVAQITVA